eukprot:751785-Hanusia_phi.AAC.3
MGRVVGSTGNLSSENEGMQRDARALRQAGGMDGRRRRRGGGEGEGGRRTKGVGEEENEEERQRRRGADRKGLDRPMSVLCLACVNQSERGILQSCGKFSRILDPGFSCICWPWQTVTQLDVHTKTKTKDNVTVTVTCAVQYAVNPQQSESFYFKLCNPKMQISAYVDDCVRSHIPSMTLDEAFEAKETLVDAVKLKLHESMKDYGIIVHQALVTDMNLEKSVTQAMNKINAARREREAAIEIAEANKILLVRAAEADAEAKYLNGKGIALMREAISNGFKSSIQTMQESCGLEPNEVVEMMLVTQYMDVLKDFARSERPCLVVPFAVNSSKQIDLATTEIELPMPETRSDLGERKVVVLNDSTIEAALEEVSQLHLSTLLAKDQNEEELRVDREECMA